ncbi:MAG: coproporphyrinogen dehydrogenase HemZ [Clostridiales bacterium]|nr:coproporphyrinogen dehydrogenase HemZ [Clostridiales bacterium]
MKTQLVGSPHLYSLEQSAITFFPDTEGEAVCTVTHDERGVTARTIITLPEGKSACRECTEAVDTQRNEQKAIKLSFYDAACELRNMKEPWGALTGVRPAKLARSLLESGLTKNQTRDTLKKEYRLSAEKAELCVTAGLKAYNIKRKLRERDACIYIGIPFCPSRCVYCSFISVAAGKNDEGKIEEYVQALCREIRESAEGSLFSGRTIKAVYIGGGTPAMLSPAQLIRVVAALKSAYNIPEGIEFTIEAGRPDAITKEKLHAIKLVEADRLSVNPQTTDDEVLIKIGRHHTSKEIVDTYHEAKKVGFGSINMDIIAGLPLKNEDDDGLESFCRTIDDVVSLAPENITVHTFALKRGSFLNEYHLSIPDSETVYKMLEYAEENLKAQGYEPYYLYRQKYMTGNMENIGWTKRGYESLYNICMMEELCDIISFGAGGVSKLTDGRKIKRITNHKYPKEYIYNIDEMIKRKRGE